MQLTFENKTAAAFRETAHLLKTVQETAETVVPDTNDDIGKIVSVRTNLLLKSKENTAQGVCVEGEAEAAVLYITESADAVSFVKLSRKFSLDFEVPEMTEEEQSHILLSLTEAQARIINPRKLSVTFSVTGALTVYAREPMLSQTLLPEKLSEKSIHVKRESREFSVVTAAAERTFAVSEQFSFPNGKAAPEKLVSEKADFVISDTQVIGTKAIVRGELKVEAVYLSEAADCPMKTEFSAPFSQIIETGEEQTEMCVSTIELCSQYFELADAVNGEKMLHAEIHALLQTVGCRTEKCSYIADAYSNRLPCTCEKEIQRQTEPKKLHPIKLVSDGKIMVSEDCADVLSILPMVLPPVFSDETVSAETMLDIVYRSTQGELCSVRRTLSMQGEYEGKNIRPVSFRLSDVYLRADGGVIDAHVSLELKYMSEEVTEISAVTSLSLDEEAPYDLTSFPTVTIVRAEGEELWEYARRYHSSVEEIEAVNGGGESYAGKLLLIPKQYI